ncbi:hypothetical protein ACWDRB_59850 [Nonomuraea sp. NPDC003707]
MPRSLRPSASPQPSDSAHAEIDALSARLDELSKTIKHLRISRKTLISLADEDLAPAEPIAPPTVPDRPAYQQSLTVFGEVGGSLRARDPALTRNGIQHVRAKLKRLASRGILVETEPGSFTQPRPKPDR